MLRRIHPAHWAWLVIVGQIPVTQYLFQLRSSFHELHETAQDLGAKSEELKDEVEITTKEDGMPGGFTKEVLALQDMRREIERLMIEQGEAEHCRPPIEETVFEECGKHK